MKRVRMFGLAWVLCAVACGGGGPPDDELMSALTPAQGKSLCDELLTDLEPSNAVISGECASELVSEGDSESQCSSQLSACISSVKSQLTADRSSCGLSSSGSSCTATVGMVRACFADLKSYFETNFAHSTCADPSMAALDATTAIDSSTNCQSLTAQCQSAVQTMTGG